MDVIKIKKKKSPRGVGGGSRGGGGGGGSGPPPPWNLPRVISPVLLEMKIVIFHFCDGFFFLLKVGPPPLEKLPA